MQDKKYKNINLNNLRDGIDAIDIKIQNLLVERLKIVKQVAIAKKNQGRVSYRDPVRENTVIRAVKKRNENIGVISDSCLINIFREIISSSLSLEEDLVIAYLGPEGTFSQDATYKYFGKSITTLSCNTITDVFNKVNLGEANYGIVPVYNSTNGLVTQTIDSFYDSDLYIIGETYLTIHHHLMSNDFYNEIKTIYAHSQTFNQCKNWLADHYPHIKKQQVESNAFAAKKAQIEQNTAAIGSTSALNLYNLKLLAQNIEDYAHNKTRFFCLSKTSYKLKIQDQDKTTCIIIAKDRTNSLHNVLEPLLDLKIEVLQVNRHLIPNKKDEYLFFVDIAGHKEQYAVDNALRYIQSKVDKLKILGSYPTSKL